MNIISTIVLLLAGLSWCLTNPDLVENKLTTIATADEIITGADQVDQYLPNLIDKRVGMLVNVTSIIGQKLSVDSLLALGIDIRMIFGPGTWLSPVLANETDPDTGIPIISLYGNCGGKTK